jgi:hypothetical protein
MNLEHFVEWKLAGKTEVLGENLPQWHFFQYTNLDYVQNNEIGIII